MLQRSIDDVVATTVDIDWSICIRDVAGREVAGRNADRSMKTASIGKLLLLVEVARQCAEGDLTGTTLLGQDPELRVADSGIWQHLHVEELAVHDLCVLIASVSDNLATNALLKHVGLQRLHDLAESLGLEHTALLDYVRDHRGPDRPGDAVDRIGVRVVAGDESAVAQRAGISNCVRTGECLAGDERGPLDGRVRIRPRSAGTSAVGSKLHYS